MCILTVCMFCSLGAWLADVQDGALRARPVRRSLRLQPRRRLTRQVCVY